MDNFWSSFGIILVSLLGSKRSQKADLFLERFPLALWRHFGRFLGHLGPLLGGQVVQIYCKKQYKTINFKIDSLRYRSSLGWLLKTIWTHFREVLGPKWSPKIIKNMFQKWFPKIPLFELVLYPLRGPFWGQPLLQKVTKDGTTFGTSERRR